MKENKTKLKWLATGAVLMGAATLWWNSKSGQKARGDIKDSMEEFYDYLQPKLKKFKKIGRMKFQEVVKRALEEYANLKGLSEKETSELMEKFEDNF